MRGLALVGVMVLAAGVVEARDLSSPAVREVSGTAVSSKPNTLIVKTDNDDYAVFEVDEDTDRPDSIPAGARVTVDVEDGATSEAAPHAARVTVEGQRRPQPGGDNVPPQLRQAERDISRTARRLRAGIRGGVGLDPELVSVGAHITVGPVFNRKLFFRPNAEFAYGELTSLFAVNLEGIYRLTDTMPRGSWSPYVGGGPMLGFSHQGFTTPAGTERSFDFGNFDFNGGIGPLALVERPNGTFIELKSTIYGDPHVRLLFGFTF